MSTRRAPSGRPFAALRGSLREGYSLARFRADALAGLVVGIVALPLSMALAIAVGVPPQNGLYTAIVAGAVIAALGGSRVQISGPTAAFVVILLPIAVREGLGGLCIATAMAGLILVAMGAARLGRMVSFIPYPVVTGFTAGIAIVIATLQVKDLLGLAIPSMPAEFLEKLIALADHAATVNWPDALVGAVTLAVLLAWPRLVRRVPAPLVAIVAGALLAALLARLVPESAPATISTRFGGVPQGPPLPVLPWNLPGADGAPVGLSLSLVERLLPAAFAIAMLGAIESLLSAVVADGMTGGTHDPDAELVAQGAGNILAPFFGGFAATGAIARTATNIRAGGRTPVAAIVHALFLLLAVAALAPLLGLLPMASMAALLLLVAWNMGEFRHVARMLRIAPRSDVLVMLACLGLTVVFDMVVAVTAGVALAGLLFIRRMTEVSSVALVGAGHGPSDLGPGVLVYEIAGPLFFGAAQKAMSAIRTADDGVRAVLLDMRDVPAMDATGLVNLESTLASLRSRGVGVILAGVQPQPLRALERAGVGGAAGVSIHASFEAGVAAARQLA